MTNVFIINDEKLYTPPINDGCVDGTMRRWIIGKESVIEKSLLISDIIHADEIFLSNAMKGITSVSIFSEKRIIEYNTIISKRLQDDLINSSLDF